MAIWRYIIPFVSLLLLGFTCGEEPEDPYANIIESTEWETGVQTGKLQGNFADEMSGMAASILNPGLYWIHNDGSIKKLFLIDTLGNKYAELILPTDIEFNDVEDMACGILNGKSTLFIGDIGDNDRNRKNYTIHKIDEPLLAKNEEKSVTKQDLTSIIYSYNHNISRNGECLMYDPIDQKLILLVKDLVGIIYEIDANQSGFLAGVPDIGFISQFAATGGCINKDGSRTIIRSRGSTLIFSNSPGEPLSKQLANNLPFIGPNILETQGEAICFNLSGSGFLTCSEAAGTNNQPIFYYKRK